MEVVTESMSEIGDLETPMEERRRLYQQEDTVDYGNIDTGKAHLTIINL